VYLVGNAIARIILADGVVPSTYLHIAGIIMSLTVLFSWGGRAFFGRGV